MTIIECLDHPDPIIKREVSELQIKLLLEWVLSSLKWRVWKAHNISGIERAQLWTVVTDFVDKQNVSIKSH